MEAVELSEASLARDSGDIAVPFTWRGINKERQGMDVNYKTVNLESPQNTQKDEPMPTDPNSPVGRAWMVSCIVHQIVPDSAPEQEVLINGRWVRAVLDTGSSVTLVCPQLLGTTKLGRSCLPITCVHGDTRYVPAQTVSISAAPGTWLVEVGVLFDLPLLLGRDWPGLDQLLRRTELPARHKDSCTKRKAQSTSLPCFRE